MPPFRAPSFQIGGFDTGESNFDVDYYANNFSAAAEGVMSGVGADTTGPLSPSELTGIRRKRAWVSDHINVIQTLLEIARSKASPGPSGSPGSNQQPYSILDGPRSPSDEMRYLGQALATAVQIDERLQRIEARGDPNAPAPVLRTVEDPANPGHNLPHVYRDANNRLVNPTGTYIPAGTQAQIDANVVRDREHLQRDRENNQSREQISREDNAAKLNIANMERQSAIDRAAYTREGNLVRQGLVDVRIVESQAKERIERYNKAASLVEKSIDKMSDIDRADLTAWTEMQKLSKGVYDQVMGWLRAKDDRESREDETAFQGAYAQRNARIAANLRIAESRHADYKKALESTLYAPQEWWDAYQRGNLAIAAGRRVPRDVFEVLSRGGDEGLHYGRSDPDNLARTMAGLMGGDATVQNPLGSDVRPQLRQRSERPPDWQPDYTSRPTMAQSRAYTQIGMGLGVQGMTTPPPHLGEVTPIHRAPGGFVAPGATLDRDDFGDDDDDDRDFGFEDSEDQLMELSHNYIDPLIDNGSIEPDFFPYVAATTAAVYGGADPQDAIEQIWGPLGHHWTLDENDWGMS